MLCGVIDVHFLSMEKSYVFSWGIRLDGKTREVCVGVINTEFCSVATSFRKQEERVAIRESNREIQLYLGCKLQNGRTAVAVTSSTFFKCLIYDKREKECI